MTSSDTLDGCLDWLITAGLVIAALLFLALVVATGSAIITNGKIARCEAVGHRLEAKWEYERGDCWILEGDTWKIFR